MPQNGKSFHQRTLQMGSRCRLEREAARRTTTLAWQREKTEVAPGSSGKGGANGQRCPGGVRASRKAGRTGRSDKQF